MTLSHVTVTLSFIPGFTHSCHGSSLALARFPHTNEHLCDHVFIIILLTSALLSPRPGWNRRWCYHRSDPKPLCESHRNLGTSHHGAIRHKPTNYRHIHKSAFSGHKSFNSHSFCSLSRLDSRHFAILDAVFQPHVGQYSDFLAWRYCESCIYAWLRLGIFSIFSSLKRTKSSIFSDFLHS